MARKQEIGYYITYPKVSQRDPKVEFKKYMTAEFKKMVKEARKMFGKVTKTWQPQHKPSWLVRRKLSGTDWHMELVTSRSKSPVFYYLEAGTRIRFMTVRGRPKTKYRYLGTIGPGTRKWYSYGESGILRPGIEAREWSFAIGNLLWKKFPENLNKNIIPEFFSHETVMYGKPISRFVPL